MRKSSLFFWGTLGLMLGFIAACTPVTQTEESTYSLSGTAVKGPVAAGTATAYSLNSDGSRGAAIATAATGSDGQFSLSLGTYAGAVEVVITGGSYVDEATGTTVSLGTGEELRVMTQAKAGTPVAVTALTTIAAANARATAAQEGLDTAIEAAKTRVAAAFGLSDVDLDGTVPADLTDASGGTKTMAQKKYGSIQAGLTQLAAANSLQAGDVLKLMKGLAEDFSDGDFDGTKSDGTAVQTGLSVSPVQAMNGLQAAVQAFLGGERNKSGYRGATEAP